MKNRASDTLAQASDFLSPIKTGRVVNPASRSAFMSRMSNGMVMANTNRHLSRNINPIWVGSYAFPDCITGKKMVAADQAKAIRKIFSKGTSRSLKIFLLSFLTGSEYRKVTRAMGAKVNRTSFFAANIAIKKPTIETPVRHQKATGFRFTHTCRSWFNASCLLRKSMTLYRLYSRSVAKKTMNT